MADTVGQNAPDLPLQTATLSVGDKRPQPHGGALTFGNPGNKGGHGATPSVIRDRLRGSFYERAPMLEAIADGKPMVQMRVVLGPLLEHLSCPNCGESGLGLKGDGAPVEITIEGSATPKDRLGALDLMAKYGVGALKEVSVDQVRERVQETLRIIRHHVPPDVLERMMPELRKAWG